ncbi:hypothetical protein [Streptococcus pyogenes NS88.2]|nr:hypothetical protein [Streptococcus pyogenes NS88.2]
MLGNHVNSKINKAKINHNKEYLIASLSFLIKLIKKKTKVNTIKLINKLAVTVILTISFQPNN